MYLGYEIVIIVVVEYDEKFIIAFINGNKQVVDV
jgi:hypothetical protein